MEDLPNDFAIELGRILFLGGRVEMLLDRLLAPAGGEPPRHGFSGTRLIKELRNVSPHGDELSRVVNGYEDMHTWRNHLVHGSHNYANGVMWTWREPTAAKGRAALSLQFSLETLRGVAESWQNLAHAAESELLIKTQHPIS